MASLQLLATLDGHTDRVWHVAWHPTLDVLATCSGDRSVRVWAPKPSSEDAFPAVAAAVAAGGGSSSSAARLRAALRLAAPSWQCIATADDFTTRTVRCVEWSPCGRFLAAASFDSNTTIFRVVGPALSLAAMGGGGTRAVRAGDLSLEAIVTLEGHENEVKGVAWAPSGALLATCSRDKSVWVWEALEEGEDFDCVAVLQGHEQDVKAVRWHPSRELLASASYDDRVKVWGEAEDDWEAISTLEGHSSTVWAVAWHPAGDRLASASDDGSVIVYAARPAPAGSSTVVDALTFHRTAAIPAAHSRSVLSIDWAPAHAVGVDDDSGGSDGEGSDGASVGGREGHGPALLASCGADDALRVFREELDVGSAAASPVGAGPSGSAGGGGAAPSDAGPRVSFALVAAVPSAHAGEVNCVRWHPRGTGVLATAGDDGLVRVWRYTEA